VAVGGSGGWWWCVLERRVKPELYPYFGVGCSGLDWTASVLLTGLRHSLEKMVLLRRHLFRVDRSQYMSDFRQHFLG
jgi:hypothetical protein